MASKGGNYFDILLNDDEERRQAKRAEKKRKQALATQGQKNSAKSKASQKAAASRSVPVVDASRPEKRVFDRISGTGRGKEVPKEGHNVLGKVLDEKVIEEAKEEVLQEMKEPVEKKETKPKEKKPKEEKPKEEKPKEEKPKEEKKPRQETLQQYTAKINSQIINLPDRQLSRPNEMETEADMSNFVILRDIETDDSPFVNAPAPKQAHKKEEKPQPKKESTGEKKQKRPEDMTTADFFISSRMQRPAREDRRERRPFRDERRPPRDEHRPPRQPRPENNQVTLQVWKRVDGKAETETRVVSGPAPTAGAAAPIPRGPAPARHEAPRKPALKTTMKAFPTLGGNKPSAPKKTNAAGKAAQN